MTKDKAKGRAKGNAEGNAKGNAEGKAKGNAKCKTKGNAKDKAKGNAKGKKAMLKAMLTAMGCHPGGTLVAKGNAEGTATCNA